ncbi:MAG: hydantoinase/oxoprolinase family protein, partial [Actinomycetota bacterium]
REAAVRAVQQHVGDPLGLDAQAAADSILKVATAQMSGAIRLVSIERGHEPGDFAAMPYGGAGALHACPIVADLGLAAAIVPRYPGVISALGCVIADLRHDVVHTVNVDLDALDAEALRSRLAEDADRMRALVEASSLPVEGIDVVVELDMSYVGQTHTVTVPFDPGTGLDPAAIRAGFDATYEASYGRTLDGVSVRLLSVRTAAIGRRPAFDPSVLAPGPEASLDAATGEPREVWFDGTPTETATFERLLLPVGAEVAGPAVLEQPDATVVIDPGFTGVVDELGNLIVRQDEQAAR